MKCRRKSPEYKVGDLVIFMLKSDFDDFGEDSDPIEGKLVSKFETIGEELEMQPPPDWWVQEIPCDWANFSYPIYNDEIIGYA